MTKRSNIFTLRIAFSDCDPAQIVFFANYLKWFDTSSREFFTACGIPSWRDTTRDLGIIGTPMLDVQASFKQSATYGEDIEIETWVDEWKGKSFVMKHIARRGDDVLCEGQEVRVFAKQDPDNELRIKAVPIPDDFRTACE